MTILLSIPLPKAPAIPIIVEQTTLIQRQYNVEFHATFKKIIKCA